MSDQPVTTDAPVEPTSPAQAGRPKMSPAEAAALIPNLEAELTALNAAMATLRANKAEVTPEMLVKARTLRRQLRTAKDRAGVDRKHYVKPAQEAAGGVAAEASDVSPVLEPAVA